MELGLFSFAENRLDSDTGRPLDPGRRIRELLAEIELADQVGLDVFGVGEHHRPDYAVSAPAIVLAAAAARTERIRLTSAVTVLGSEDPVRVLQQYATIDQISEGRAEIMAGRGSFTESFPLFGQDLRQYDEVFAEKLALLLELRALGPDRVLRWRGKHRPAVDGSEVHPAPWQQPLPLWIAVGGTPTSLVRAGTLGLPVALAIIGGEPARFVPVVELYREAAARAGHDPTSLRVAISSHGFLADDARAAADLAFGPFSATMNRIGRERGWPPTTRAHFDAEARLEGALVMGGPEEWVEKILYQHRLFGHDRFLAQLTVGPLPHADVLRAIELYGTEVAPAVRRELDVGGV